MVCAISVGAAVAIGAAAVVGAGATVYAADKSASAVTSSTNASIAEQNKALTQQQQLNAPYSAIGTGTNGNNGAIAQYQNLLGLGPQGAAGEEAALAATPGYQFALNQGTQATTNAASANGMALSGNTLESLDSFSTGLADSTYQNAVGNAQNAVGIGQAAAAGNISNSLTTQGNTIAGIDANEAAGVTKALSGGVNQATTLNTLSGLNNPGGGIGGDGIGGGYGTGANSALNNPNFFSVP